MTTASYTLEILKTDGVISYNLANIETLIITGEMGPTTSFYSSNSSTLINKVDLKQVDASALICEDAAQNAFKDLFNGCINLESANFANIKCPEIRNSTFYEMFKGCTSLISVNFSSLTGTNSLEAVAFLGMFHGCTSLTSVAFPNLTGPNNVIDAWGVFWGMFEGCIDLRSVDLYALKTLNINNDYAGRMFFNCSSLNTLYFQLPFGDAQNGLRQNAFFPTNNDNTFASISSTFTVYTLYDNNDTSKNGWSGFSLSDQSSYNGSDLNISLLSNPLQISSSSVNHISNNNGSINITVSGGIDGNYSYIWSGPSEYSASTDTISNLSTPGEYAVTVTDFSGSNSLTQSFTVNIQNALTLPSQVASATGDPYITPIYGNLYKLPNRTAYYRLLKHNDTIINGEVVRFDEAQINYECTLRNFQMHKFAPNNFDLSSMYFFKNIYIHHNGNETVYNLLDQTFTNNCFKHEMTKTKLETCKIYYYENMEACEIDLGGIEIKLCTFDNPQIITGIDLKVNKYLSKASGLLVHQQSSKPHVLKNIKSKKETYKVEKQGRIVKEQFFTQTHNGTESNIREITVL